MMQTVGCVLLAVVAGKPIHIPGGHVVDEACVVEVPAGKVFDADTAAPRTNCAPSLSVGVQIYASDVHLKSSEPLTGFTADWVVPEKPIHSYGQVVYFWPGFKAQQPEMGLPVLQPVLQWGQRGSFWELQSWFVDGNDPSYPYVTAPSIRVSPGDRITSYMSLSADGQTWTVSGTDLTTGEDSTLQIKYSSAGNTDYDYAMLVNENIGVDASCSKMPAGSELVFTNVTVNGKIPGWTTRANCAGNSRCDCGNSATVDSSDEVHLGWSTGTVV